MFAHKLALGVVLLAVIALVAVGAVEFGQQLFISGPPATGVSEGNAQELAIKREKLIAAKAELESFTAAKDDALNRLEGMKWANERHPNTFAHCEIREAMLTYKRCVNEETAKRAAIELAELELSPAGRQLDIMKQKVTVAKAELEGMSAAKDEAFCRLDSMRPANPLKPFTVEEFQEAKRSYEHFVQEEIEKQAAYEQAQRELDAYLTTAFEGQSSSAVESHH
jgi:hypothetical protein